MSSSIGLKLYTLGKRRDQSGVNDWPKRPEGRLIWLHAPGEVDLGPMLALAARLVEEDGLPVLLTTPTEIPRRDALICLQPPNETTADASAFLDHWRPEIILFADGELRPVVIHEAAARQIPMLVVNGREPRFPPEREGWYPGLMRSALGRLRAIMTLDEAAARAFRKGGAPLSTVAVLGRMEEVSAVLGCNEAERSALGRLLATRPVWLAAGICEAEEEAVLAAHRMAQQHSHRLLLIVLPENRDRAEPFAKALKESGEWNLARRHRDEEPEPNVDILVTDDPEEYGLWYRLAPVTFLGGSLSGKGPVRNPMEAAALGSAIMHGTRTGQYGKVFGRLGAARATRAVASATDLGDALSDMLVPDRAARLAHAGWAVSSEGAEVTDMILERIRAIMDGEE